MIKKSKRNTCGLLKHTAALKNETEEKVNQAIDTLKRSKTKKINFKAVSELSGVSTTTLYNNPVLRERISSLRAVQKVQMQAMTVSDTSAQDRDYEMRQEIHRLREEKHMLINQLVELDNLRIENKKLKALLSQRRLE